MKFTNIILVTLLLFVSTHAMSSDKVSACSTRIWVPFTWETDDSIDGVGSVIAKRFFAEQGVKLELVVIGSWARCLKLIEDGTIDLALAAYKNDERAHFANYVEEAMGFDYMQIFINKENPITFTDLDDLRKYRGGGVAGDSYGEEFNRFKATLTTGQWLNVTKTEQNIEKLARKKLDYVPLNPWNMEILLNNLKKSDYFPQNVEFATVGEPIHLDGLYFMFSKKSNKYKDYGEKLNLFVKQLKASGELEQILNDSFARYKAQLIN